MDLKVDMDPITDIRNIERDYEADRCARIISSSEPWTILGRTPEMAASLLADGTKEVYAAFAGNDPIGVVVINMQGAFAGYIQTLCVADGCRGKGVGGKLLSFAEERIFRDFPNVFLCVSSFNERAKRFYEQRGYNKVGELTDYVVSGHSEFIMRKTLGPISAFKTQPITGR